MQVHNLYVLLLFLFHISSSRTEHNDNGTPQPESTDEKFQNDTSTLEEALVSLSELATIQKQVWEQQEAHREQMQVTFGQFSEEAQKRSMAVEAEQSLLKEIRDNISRKLKVLSKSGNKARRQSNCNGDTPTEFPPKDCAAIYESGDDLSGVYKVWPTWNENGESFPVYCDMDTDGGSWTLIYRREKFDIPNNYFKRSWEEYRNGFGDLTTSFFLGTHKIHQLTNQGAYQLRFDFQNSETERSSSVYGTFRVDNADNKYAVHVEEYDPFGTAGDIFTSTNGSKFSTFDQNNLRIHSRPDPYREYETPPDCARTKETGWWFHRDCVIHPILQLIKTSSQSKIEMKIRPV